jgi:hypothetical protein
MNILKKLLRRNNYPVTKHETKYAFTCGGVDYYQFADFNNTPALRGLKTMVFYEEMKMKCTLDFLRLHTEAIDNLITPKPGRGISIKEIGILNDQLKQRLDLALDTELLYKIASINFFDSKENLEDYDFDYNAQKVERWKKYAGADFFLQQPLQELLPVLKSIGSNLEKFSQTVEKLNNLHLGSLLASLPLDKMKTLKGKSYFSSVVMPRSSKL